MGIKRGLHLEGTGKIQYASVQASWFFSCESFQIEFTAVSLNWKGEGGDENSSICFSYRKFDVHDGVYEANNAHIVVIISRFLANLEKEHFAVIKWIMRYLQGMTKANLCFSARLHELVCYSDADWDRWHWYKIHIKVPSCYCRGLYLCSRNCRSLSHSLL